MKNYYFLTSAFPKIQIGEKPDLDYESLKNMLAINLSEKDKRLLANFLLYNDLQNLRSLWLNRPLLEMGNLGASDIEAALQTGSHFPEYVFDFLARYETTQERLLYFSKMLVDFFAEANRGSGFIKNYFAFERQRCLILLALRAKDKQADIAAELQFEDPQDPFVAYILAQKDAENFEAPVEYESLKNLYLENRALPLNLYRAYLQYRFDKINDMIEPLPFTMDYILGFIALYMIVDGWSLQNSIEGQAAVLAFIE